MTGRLWFDFAIPPERRRRAGELTFYRRLACAALLGALPVVALGWRIDRHTAGIDAASRLLGTELQALQPHLSQAAAARQAIAAMQGRLAVLDKQAAQRAQAARLLRTLGRLHALAAPLRGRLERIALRAQHAELHGYATQTSDVQAYADALLQAGLEGVAIRNLRMLDKNGEEDRYEFTLSIPLSAPPPASTVKPAVLL